MEFRIHDEKGDVYVYGTGRVTAPTGKPAFSRISVGNTVKIAFMVTVNVKKKPQTEENEKTQYEYTNLNCAVYFANVGKALFSLASTVKLHEKIEFFGKWRENVYTDASTGEMRTVGEVVIESFNLPARMAEIIMNAENLDIQSKKEIRAEIEKQKKGFFGTKAKEEEYLF